MESFQRAIDALDALLTAPGSLAPLESHVQITSRHLRHLDLEEPLSELSVIHVAGTKGKGSTCAFVEEILRASGFRTGLFTSPHLLDVRERFRFDGQPVSQELFAKYFWWCWERLQALPGDSFHSGVSIARVSRFLTVLAFKMFISEKVDVAIIEVGLGGRYDTTNVVKSPVVCGVTSLGYDHMEVLGSTLGEIASQKAGIFKAGVPAITVPQASEALDSLQKRAKELNICLEVAAPLTAYGLGDLELGLKGEHQRVNAALAVALCKRWAGSSGHNEHKLLVENAIEHARLPDSYITGLVQARWEGRAQVIHDKLCSNLSFYIDGAHSPESMEVCGKWFSSASKADASPCGDQCKILLFNCMPKRDPQLLLPRLKEACAREESPIQLALFVPPYSSSFSVRHICTGRADTSWQEILWRHWEALEASKDDHCFINSSESSSVVQQLKDDEGFSRDTSLMIGSSSAVLPSLPSSIQWLQRIAKGYPQLHLQVLVTGSLHLVGDVLKLIKYT
ncbi:hypothetical protein SELMODRAFT_402687 [Selaginella moellendorffii]|uniref:Folylpolyglutamate synthase n=1 Tax=Selaginella moellendorffii TaxID=88036 RepID=D8QMQ8_SELML|nr:folylpolyglutamate synthase isoform X1 [Selaginella moellendorffii]EFJ38623.1 hypothetical protein SELMODRAFT_402687 [Selaginella moellendorffii]|eukprot:XP_002961084.1 folylpolyglutamate synthase isoform X1 [Selaginella moellendorffii]